MYFNSFSVEDTNPKNPSKEASVLINKLKNNIQNEREKILLLKNRYTQKLDEKNEMEKLLRKCINDYKQDLWEIKTNMRYQTTTEGEESSSFNEVEEQKLSESGPKLTLEDKMKVNVKDILEKEKRLSLLHDKIFFGRRRILKGEIGFQMA